ncbi:protein-export membrane protein SecF [Candidatus Gottesmanbacteria bacterium RBG_16_43_7]|uniref:Protein-export membrane protein SecF n=1 Tax=Candidatus Gottesmanbacteria bacterium RBG_16_43_7 TaxID=1798373 RepID=A0A1F5ZA37_9BACT|nr:MAG: protein-export membrane protein SecF [Candidatus Gottesmanbacteria bacterium RBG_16_43_7]
MIRFSKYITVYILLSSAVLLPGIFSLVRWGLKPAIDFAGGTLIELKLPQNIGERDIKQVAARNDLTLSSLQITSQGTVLLRTKTTIPKTVNAFVTDLITPATNSAEIIRQETVGPVLGKELLFKAIVAAFIAVVGILLYVAYAFSNFRFGMAAIIALGHDLLVVSGAFSLLGHFWGVEVDTLFVTAVLTTMSFSVHDTIVVFDRIREHLKKDNRAPLTDVVDRALTETMGRSLANSFTIILMLLALVLMGGETVKWFAVALLIGTISGTYSSPFVAAPVLILWNRLKLKKKIKTPIKQI